ncbi:hypothetical protein P9X10_01070 [Bacillus cereus]|nr:hypothetical protein [Bacillus cereus]
MFIVKSVFKYFDYVVRAKSAVTKDQIDGETLIFKFWLWANFIGSMVLTLGASYVTVAFVQAKLGYFTEWGLWVLTPIAVYGLLSVLTFSFFNVAHHKIEVKRMKEYKLEVELNRMKSNSQSMSVN